MALRCERAAPSAVAELAWLLDLLVQGARYAEPALDELDRSLLPGIAALRPSIRESFVSLWNDAIRGCPELLVLAHESGRAPDDDPRGLFSWLSTLPSHPAGRHELLSEVPGARRAIRRRLDRLATDVRLRRAYRNVLSEVWSAAAPAWERRGRASAARAAAEYRRRLASARTASDVVRSMPPRHPLTRADPARVALLFRRRPRFAVAPMFFCMSGGSIVDLDDHLHIGVPASANEPVRRNRDALFVASRARVLAEPTRVHVLIHLLSRPSGVMEMTRALKMSQPTVSEHVRVLMAAGVIRRRREGSRTVLVPAERGFERLLEDARATLARWV
ncbi:MAG TPA: metalloregulator ArsR/SmtB family transcription factor [Candidatus Dormibacteraeota bacterium]|nr:metalloregulator ArsR/SmtB family transcription factor [Candidatus Dormibacteraeota bacterium]